MPPILIPPRGKVDFQTLSPALPSNSNQPSETHTARERRTGRERDTGRNAAREKEQQERGRESTFWCVCCCETSCVMIRVITAAVAQTHYGTRCSSSHLGRTRHPRYHIHSRHQHCDTHRQGEAAGGRRRGRRGSASVCVCVRSTAGTAAHQHANKIDLNSSINHNNHCRCPF